MPIRQSATGRGTVEKPEVVIGDPVPTQENIKARLQFERRHVDQLAQDPRLLQDELRPAEEALVVSSCAMQTAAGPELDRGNLLLITLPQGSFMTSG